MLDALEADLDHLVAIKPSVCVEVGSGSGCNITFLGTILRHNNINPALISTDINHHANKATISTGNANQVRVEAINTSLTLGLRPGTIDVLLFNPPYVPTEEAVPKPEEIWESSEKCLEAAWAGGESGRFWIDKLLPFVPSLLTPHGSFYMVVVDENKPADIVSMAARLGLNFKLIIDRKARNEHLSIIRFTKKRS